MKAFIFSAHPYELPYLTAAARDKHTLLFTNKKLSLETVPLAAGCDAVAIFTSDLASEEVLHQLHLLGIRYIALRSAGYDHVDLVASELYKMHVANVPAYSPFAIAEHAVALLLAFNRKIIEGHRLIASRDFRLDTLTGFDLHGKTVGIIGTGTIGMTFAKIMTGFGVDLIGYDIVQSEEAVALGLRYVSLDELYRKSDIISIHCPLNDATRYLIQEKQLLKMKKHCILINTSRGAIVNTTDLLDALDADQVGGACLDVYEYEKALFFEDHRDDKIPNVLFDRIASNKKVLVTGHQAFLTAEALKGIADTVVVNLDFWGRGKASPYELGKAAVVNM